MQQIPVLTPTAAPRPAKPLTPFQERTLLALDDSAFGATHVNESPTSSDFGFWRVAVFALGVFCMVAGFALLFFLTALGAGLSLLGGVTCLMAYERGAVRNELPSPPARAEVHLEDASVH